MTVISIVVPVYNAAATIGRMLDSIKEQSMSDFEVLMINDGSTDESGDILDGYHKEDPRFKVIHKNNGGVASARQIGIEQAKGEYVIHADSDDWLDSTMLEELYAKAKKEDADIVICDYFTNNNNGQHYVTQQPSSLVPQQVMRDLFQQLHGSCCNKLVKRVCYNKIGARFFPGIDYCEDLFFWYQILSHSWVKVAYLNKAFYHYYCAVEHDSIVGRYNKSILVKGMLLVRKMEEILPESKVKEDAIKCFKLRQKYGTFEHPIFTSKEYYAIYPECNKFLFSIPTSFLNRTLVWLSFHGFYHIATSLYVLKNSIMNNKIR